MGACDKLAGGLRWLWRNFVLFVTSITIEPAYLIFAISQGLYLIVSAELYISKVCRVNLNYSEYVCDNIHKDEYDDEQNNVQKYVSTLRIYNSILQAVPSVLFALFAGPWSDTNGRKFLIMSSLFGFVFNNAVFMINTYWFFELKAEYLLFECLQDCTGGFVCFFMSVNAYMADITEEKHRTKRVAFMSGLFPIGFNVGKALGGLIKTKLGFMYNFGIGMILSLTAMLYVLIFVRDSVKIRERRLRKEREEKGEDAVELQEIVDLTQLTLGQKIKTLFDLKNLLAGFKALFQWRPHGLRKYLILMVLCFEMEMIVNIGEGSNYLYLRKVLDFKMSDYTRYSTIVGAIGIVAQYITVPLFSEKFGLHDSTIILIDIGGCFVQTVLLAFVKAEWMLYLGACIAFLDATSFTMIRCMITKHVDPDEVGKLLSVVGALQAFVPLIFSPIFGVIYRETVASFPQTYLVVLAVLFATDWALLLFINVGVRRVARYEAAEKAEAELKERMLEQENAVDRNKVD